MQISAVISDIGKKYFFNIKEIQSNIANIPVSITCKFSETHQNFQFFIIKRKISKFYFSPSSTWLLSSIYQSYLDDFINDWHKSETAMISHWLEIVVTRERKNVTERKIKHVYTQKFEQLLSRLSHIFP